METRNITIVSTKNQTRTVVNTDATTLAELKSALRAANVDYEGMTFYEGLTHTELLTDESILPHDVSYKGTITNELVFMLTNPEKKIKSGALSEARAALYAAIAEKHLESACVEKYSKNLTNCSNAELLSIVEEASAAEGSCNCSNLEKAFMVLVESLDRDSYISDVDVRRIKSALKGTDNSPYTDDDIDDMFNFLS